MKKIVKETADTRWKQFFKSAADSKERWNFANCIHCIDRKHGIIKTPWKSGTIFSIITSGSVYLQGVADDRCDKSMQEAHRFHSLQVVTIHTH